MARIVKEQEYAERRNVILDAAQRRILSDGYEQMAIQDILNDLRISKGAFYHYFDSKQALLEALIERMLQEIEQQLRPITQIPGMGACERLQNTFSTLVRWKSVHSSFLFTLLRAWYTDENAIVRQKVRARVLEHLTPLLMVSIWQGIEEGVFTISYPEQAGEVIVSLGLDLSDSLGLSLLSYESEQGDMRRIERTIAAYTEALERMLGIAPASLCLIDTQTLEAWVTSVRDHV